MPPNAVEEVRQALRETILRGDYGPNQRLIEADLCAELNASRFTVRKALQDLASEGLIEVCRNKGARVRVVSLDEAIEIAEVRQVVEALVAERAASRVTPVQAAELEEIGLLMERAVKQAELLRYHELNARLHEFVRVIAGQATASRILDQLRGQLARHQFLLLMQPARASLSLPQHQRLIAAIVAHNPEAAGTAAREHVESIIEALRQLAASPQNGSLLRSLHPALA
jgi:DNA-binding GntR family transcriptional regulator